MIDKIDIPCCEFFFLYFNFNVIIDRFILLKLEIVLSNYKNQYNTKRRYTNMCDLLLLQRIKLER